MIYTMLLSYVSARALYVTWPNSGTRMAYFYMNGHPASGSPKAQGVGAANRWIIIYDVPDAFTLEGHFQYTPYGAPPHSEFQEQRPFITWSAEDDATHYLIYRTDIRSVESLLQQEVYSEDVDLFTVHSFSDLGGFGEDGWNWFRVETRNAERLVSSTTPWPHRVLALPALATSAEITGAAPNLTVTLGVG